MQAQRFFMDALFPPQQQQQQQQAALPRPPTQEEVRHAPTLDSSPLLECSMPSNFRYNELALLIRRIQFTRRKPQPASVLDSSSGVESNGEPYEDAATATSRQLTPDLMRKVVSYLVVQPVRHDQVRVIGCSSHDNHHPLASILSPDEDTWWISASNTMNYGRGREYVDFELAPRQGVSSCRLTSISIKIPPLPVGPLSVRQFELLRQVEHFSAGGDDNASIPANRREDDNNDTATKPVVVTWTPIPLVTATLQNVTGWQQFHLALPVDAKAVRLVCLCNQISRFMQPDSVLPTLVSPFDSVGFFAIRFD